MPGGNSAFGALCPLGDAMDLGRYEKPNPRDAAMSDPGVIFLKRALSPSKLPHPGLVGIPAIDVPSPTEESSLSQVSAPPCMVGKMVDGPSKSISVRTSSRGPDLHWEVGKMGFAPGMLGTVSCASKGSSAGGREGGVAELVMGEGLVCGPIAASSLLEFFEKPSPVPVLLTMGKDYEEKKGSSLDVKCTVHGVKGGYQVEEPAGGWGCWSAMGFPSRDVWCFLGGFG